MGNKASEIKKEIVYYAKLMDQKGFVNALEGNISILDRESGELYITPSTLSKATLTEDMVAVLKDGEQIGGNCKRSSEYLLHEAALKARPDCNAVVHTHVPYLTAYAYCNQDIELRCSTSFALLFEKIPCLPYGQPGTTHIADGIEEAMEDHDLVLLGNHGCVSVGKTMEAAMNIIEVAEEVLRIYHLTKDIGEVSNIPDDLYESICDNHPSSVRNKFKSNQQ